MCRRALAVEVESHVILSAPPPNEMHISLLVLAIASTATAVDVKGVASSDAQKYLTPVAGSSPPKWKCLNSSQEISLSAVNDNYCDCEDGTDEPGVCFSELSEKVHTQCVLHSRYWSLPNGTLLLQQQGPHWRLYSRFTRQ